MFRYGIILGASLTMIVLVASFYLPRTAPRPSPKLLIQSSKVD